MRFFKSNESIRRSTIHCGILASMATCVSQCEAARYKVNSTYYNNDEGSFSDFIPTLFWLSVSVLAVYKLAAKPMSALSERLFARQEHFALREIFDDRNDEPDVEAPPPAIDLPPPPFVPQEIAQVNLIPPAFLNELHFKEIDQKLEILKKAKISKKGKQDLESLQQKMEFFTINIFVLLIPFY